jgi:hypothetical protein
MFLNYNEDLRGAEKVFGPKSGHLHEASVLGFTIKETPEGSRFYD